MTHTSTSYISTYLLIKEQRGATIPVIIHFHGGGWIRGNRDTSFYGAPAMACGYAERGFLVVTPSYRLSSEPQHMEDAAEAVE